jgi:hypothetical protein
MKSFHLKKEARPSAISERIAVLLLWSLFGALVGLVSFVPLAAIILESRNAVFGTVAIRTHLQFLPLSAFTFAAIPLAAMINSDAERDYSQLLRRSLWVAGMSLVVAVVAAHNVFVAVRFVVDTFGPVLMPWLPWHESVVEYFLLGVPATVAMAILCSSVMGRKHAVQPIVPPNADPARP